MNSLQLTRGLSVLSRWICSAPRAVNMGQDSRIQRIIKGLRGSDRALAIGICTRNRRIIEGDVCINEKLDKAFLAAQEKKDSVNAFLSQLWSQAQPRDFQERECVQGRDGQGNTTLVHRSEGNSLGISCTQGWRPYMEDFHFASSFQVGVSDKPSQRISMYAVFDGHGGSRCAQYLQAVSESYLKRQFEKELLNKGVLETAGIFNILKLAGVRLGAQWNEQGDKSGSTAITALIIGNDLWVANVGDCRAILLDGDQTIALSMDAKPEDAVFASGVEKRGGVIKTVSGDIPRVYSTGLALEVGVAMTRAVGHPEIGAGINPRAKVIRYPLNSPDKKMLIVASDGLWDFVSTNQVADVVREWRAANPDLSSVAISDRLAKKTCQAVKAEALAYQQLPQGDNLTIMVVDLADHAAQVAGG